MIFPLDIVASSTKFFQMWGRVAEDIFPREKEFLGYVEPDLPLIRAKTEPNQLFLDLQDEWQKYHFEKFLLWEAEPH